MNSQRGGILSTMVLVPLVLVLIVGIFLLGYAVGRYQSRKAAEGEKPPTLPELAEQYLPKKEDLTFYKNLIDKGDKPASTELKPQKEAGVATQPPREPAKVEERPVVSTDKPERTITVKMDPAEETPPAATAKRPAAKKETVNKETAKKEAVIASASGGKIRYTVQIGAYPDKKLAEDEMRRIKKAGYAAFVVASELPDKGTWYRVRLGSFGKREAAEKLAQELKAKEGLSPFVTVE